MSRTKNAVLNMWLWLRGPHTPTAVLVLLIILVVCVINVSLTCYERRACDAAQQEYNQLPHRRPS